MIGKPEALIQVPNQRLFGMKAAARYLGMHAQTLKSLPMRMLSFHANWESIACSYWMTSIGSLKVYPHGILRPATKTRGGRRSQDANKEMARPSRNTAILPDTQPPTGL
jgi:hypothetical protein